MEGKVPARRRPGGPGDGRVRFGFESQAVPWVALMFLFLLLPVAAVLGDEPSEDIVGEEFDASYVEAPMGEDTPSTSSTRPAAPRQGSPREITRLDGTSYDAADDTGTTADRMWPRRHEAAILADTYIVGPGDTLGRIAKRTLGSADRWQEIARANPQINPHWIEVGMVLRLPPARREGSGPWTDPGAERGFPFTPGLTFPGVPSLPEGVSPLAIGPSGTAREGVLSFLEDPRPPEAISSRNESATGSSPTSLKSQFKNESYRLPEDLRPEKPTPYFTNIRGAHGLFETECALYPAVDTVDLGFSFRYDGYEDFPFRTFQLGGRQWVIPLNLLVMRDGWAGGISIPLQSWETWRADNKDQTVSQHSLGDPELRVGRMVWRDQANRQALALHLSGRVPSGNYDQPRLTMTGKSKQGVTVGPAEATRGGWLEFGGAYSMTLNRRWMGHLNLAFATDNRDGISRFSQRGSLDYRLSDATALVAELNGSNWVMENGPDGYNLEALLGLALFSRDWQATIGVPASIQGDWGFRHDFGFVFGLNYRRD